LALATAATLAMLLVPVGSAHAGGSCNQVIEQLRVEFQRGAAPAVLRATAAQHPECTAEIQAAAAAQRANAKAPGADAKGFLGPIGWLWNNVYYRVYQGNLVMMLIFGWALFLAPILVVACGYLVLHGANGAFRRPRSTPRSTVD